MDLSAPVRACRSTSLASRHRRAGASSLLRATRPLAEALTDARFAYICGRPPDGDSSAKPDA